MDPTLIALGLSFGLSQLLSYDSVKQKEAALKLQNTQEQLLFAQKQANLELDVDRALSRRRLIASGRGIGSNNPSLQALQFDTLNTASKQSKNLMLEQKVNDLNYQVNVNNLKTNLFANLLGGVEQLAFSTNSYKTGLLGYGHNQSQQPIYSDPTKYELS